MLWFHYVCFCWIGGCMEAMDENSNYVSKTQLLNHWCFTKDTQTLKSLASNLTEPDKKYKISKACWLDTHVKAPNPRIRMINNNKNKLCRIWMPWTSKATNHISIAHWTHQTLNPKCWTVGFRPWAQKTYERQIPFRIFEIMIHNFRSISSKTYILSPWIINSSSILWSLSQSNALNPYMSKSKTPSSDPQTQIQNPNSKHADPLSAWRTYKCRKCFAYFFGLRRLQGLGFLRLGFGVRVLGLGLGVGFGV